MSTILQDMMGMLKRKGTVSPQGDNYMTLARYPNPQERLKPAPKLQTELVTLTQLKKFTDQKLNAISGIGVPAYADDTAAGTGGVQAGSVFQTDGTGAAPLNVAGIVMIKQ
tara:strand:- start:83 stop:415 length:333 start_codon:yes stop_codon:yes gene_type:complete